MSDKNPAAPENCKLCGECLSRCPEMNLPLARAKAEKARLNAGEISELVSRRCTGCFDCDFFCPNQAYPAETIVKTWFEESKKNGILSRSRYFLPVEPKNFRTYVAERLPADEQALLRKWNDPSPCAEFIYPGCNVCAVPYLTMTGLLPGLPMRGGLDWCCGEMLFRMGLFDLFAKQGRLMRERFQKMGAKKILMMCTAGTVIFSRILPERFGVRFDVEFQPLLQYLWQKMESGEMKIVNRLKLTATVQDSCYGKFLGPEYLELPRRLLEKIGVRVKEMPRSRERMVCCGIGAGFSIRSGYHPLDLTRSTLKRLREAQKTGADIVCTYCAGCMQMLGVGAVSYPGAPGVYHLLELLQMAIGEKPEHRLKSRARLMLKGVLKNQLPRSLSRSRFFPEIALKGECNLNHK